MAYGEYGFGAFVVVALVINLTAMVIFDFWVPARLFKDAEASPPAIDTKPAIRTNGLISIHLAIHDEPAEQVIATLEAVRRMEYRNFEVVIIDNNTPDRSTWLPVMAYCQDHRRFRFYHFDNVQGAKAGALNLALELMNPEADYIAVLDADDQVIPRFVSDAVTECSLMGHQIVESSDAYRSAGGALANGPPLGDSFSLASPAAGKAPATLPTGTQSLICADSLRGGGGWIETAATAEAKTATGVGRKGASGRRVDRVAGQARQPFDLLGLQRQRYSRAAGNARTLLSHPQGGYQPWLVSGHPAPMDRLSARLRFGAVPLLALVASLGAFAAGYATSAMWLLVAPVVDLALRLAANRPERRPERVEVLG